MLSRKNQILARKIALSLSTYNKTAKEIMKYYGISITNLYKLAKYEELNIIKKSNENIHQNIIDNKRIKRIPDNLDEVLRLIENYAKKSYYHNRIKNKYYNYLYKKADELALKQYDNTKLSI